MLASVPSLIRDFATDDRGAMTPLIVVLFTSIILLTGISVDLLRHESARADLQASLDRGVLAATSVTQTLDAQSVIADYVDSRIWGLNTASLTVTQGNSGNSRDVVATASFDMDSMFLRLAGLDQMRVPAAAGAREAFTNVEISLVLDISGSMRWNNRIQQLRPAAIEFLSEVLAAGRSQYTSVNFITYAGSVNVGPVMFNMLGGVRDHVNSSCLDLRHEDFADIDLPALGVYPQVPHFHYWPIDYATMDWGWCPDDGDQIVYQSNDLAALTAAVNAMSLHDGTGTYIALKWAAALLNPSAQPTMATLSGLGMVPPEFADRPGAFNDPGTTKIIVLMTDGIITEQVRPLDPTDPLLATEWMVGPHGEVYHPIVQNPIDPLTGKAVAGSYPFTNRMGEDYFEALCRLAKDAGILMYTIAFEAPKPARKDMEDCASDDEDVHYFKTNANGIALAFRNIASQITQLQLVQ